MLVILITRPLATATGGVRRERFAFEVLEMRHFPGQLLSNTDVARSEGHGVSLRAATAVWARVALLSFGGPAGQIAVMHRILVEEKHWIGEIRFLHALNYCMLLPGPEAHQLAIYIGWLLHRTRGGIIAGTLFVLPGVISLGVLSLMYATFGNVGAVQGFFFGLKAAVLAVVLEAVMRVGRRALRSRAMLVFAMLAFIAIFFLGISFPIVIALAALLGFLGHRAGFQGFDGPAHAGKAIRTETAPAAIDAAFEHAIPDHVRPATSRLARVTLIGLAIWLAPVVTLLATVGRQNVFTAITLFNSKMAVVTFGGAYAVLAYMAQQAVEHYHWLMPQEMLVGLGFAETTPGPLISVVQFVGFMAAFRHPGVLSPALAGTLGGLLAAWATFVPSFVWIFMGAPYIESVRNNKALGAALAAITAAVVGVILNLAIWFALHTLFGQVAERHAGPLILQSPNVSTLNVPALLLATAAVIALFRFKVGMIPTMFGCAVAGMILLGSSATAHGAADPLPTVLTVEAKIPLGDIKGRIDHLAFDISRHRLYVAELGNDSVGVIDLESRKLIRRLTGFRQPQGIAYASTTDSVYVANASDGSVRLFEGQNLTPAGQIALGSDADNIRVSQDGSRIFVGYGDGGLAIIDPRTRSKVGEIPLQAHPESFRLGTEGSRIFVNVPDAHAIAVVDASSQKQIASWSTGDLKANFPLVLDGSGHVLAVFRHPARIGMFDAQSGSLLSSVDTCGDSDDVFIDTKRSRVYVICGEGFVAAYSQEKQQLRKAAQIATEAGARTGLFVAETDRLYVAARAGLGRPAQVWVLKPGG
jgi:chromate transporter